MDANVFRQETITSKVSAALFRSRIPSSACLIKLMNFFVKRPGKFHKILCYDPHLTVVRAILNITYDLPRELS